MDRKLREFKIYYSDKIILVENVENAVKVELRSPSALLGYRAMLKKLRQVWNFRVPRDLVHDVVYCVNPEDLESRAPGTEKKKRKGNFSSPGPGMILLLDAHGKFMDTRTARFPLPFLVVLIQLVVSCYG